ncbi:hypothetical protein [Candidatus Vidania fulgoroideorum]
MIYLLIEIFKKQYIYKNKPIKILTNNKIKGDTLNIKILSIYIRNFGFCRKFDFAIFKVLKKKVIKNKSIKFKKRKRYKRIFGYKIYENLISFKEWQKKKQQDL